MKAHEFRCFVALRGTSHVPTILQLAKDCDQALGRCVTAGCGAFLNQVSIDRDMIVMEMMGRSQLSSTNFMDKCGTIGPSIQVGHASNAEITVSVAVSLLLNPTRTKDFIYPKPIMNYTMFTGSVSHYWQGSPSTNQLNTMSGETPHYTGQ